MPLAAGLYYFAHQAEDRSRPPTILIHGAGGHHLYWPPQIRRLHDQRMFAPDLPGHGKSEGLGHQMVGDYGDEIVRFVNALKLSAVVLIGHSMGSAIALDLALRFPGRVLGLGLIGSAARLRVNPAILRNASEPATFLQAVHMVNEFSFGKEASPRLKELAGQRLAETRPSVLYGDFLTCDAFDVAGRLAEVSAPTLIVCGADDRMIPKKESESLQHQIPGSRMEIVPEAGHMVMLEKPDRVAALLGEFLSGIPYRAGSQ